MSISRQSVTMLKVLIQRSAAVCYWEKLTQIAKSLRKFGRLRTLGVQKQLNLTQQLT